MIMCDESMKALALACSYLEIDEYSKALREDIERSGYPPTYKVVFSMDDSEALKLLYGWLVCMFGDYCVNPQNGWIDKTYECCAFLTLFESMIKGENRR